MKTYYDFGKDEIPFTQVANEVLKDKNLSWKAKGLYSYLYSKPHDWQFSYERITKDSLSGEKATLAAIKELEVAGLLKRKKHADGRTTYWVTYPPHNFKEPGTENRQLDTKANYPKRLVAKIGTISNKEFNTNKENTSQSDNLSLKEEFQDTEIILSDEDGNPLPSKKPKKAPRTYEKVFNVQTELLKLKNDSWVPNKVIWEYWNYKGYAFDNFFQWKKQYDRDIKAAKDYASAYYSKGFLKRAMVYCEENYSDTGWTLETILKRSQELKKLGY